jgi:hypothetical protein
MKLNPKLNERYILMCLHAKQHLKDSIEEGDWIYTHYWNLDDKIFVLSGKSIIVRDNQSHVKIMIAPHLNAHEFTVDSQPEYIHALTGIDFNLVPEKYWFKIYRVDQLIDMIGIDSIFGLQLFIEDKLDILKSLHGHSIEESLLAYIIRDRFKLVWNDSRKDFI